MNERENKQQVPEGFKRCGKCREIKRVGEFNKNKSRKDGMDSRCRDCVKEWQKEYYKTDKCKDSRKEYQKKYHKTDKYKERVKEYHKLDKNKEYMKEYRKSDKYKERVKEYREKHQKTDKYKERMKEYRKSDKYKEYRKSSKVREFNLKYKYSKQLGVPNTEVPEALVKIKVQLLDAKKAIKPLLAD